MCVGSIKKFFKLLRERDALAWFVLLIVAVYLVFLAFSPVFRYGDDMRYFATAKTIALTGDLAPKYEIFGGTVFDGPPLLAYILTVLYFASFGNQFVWFFIAKAFMLAVFFCSFFMLNKFCNKYNFSRNEKIAVLGIFSFFPVSIFTSISAMQDQIIVLFTLLLFWLLLDKKNRYAEIGIVSGLLILTKITAFLVIGSAILAVFLLKRSRKEKVLFIAAMLAGILLINSLWMLRNYSDFGTPFYHHSMGENYELFPGESTAGKIFYVYMSTWALPTADYISGSIKFLSTSSVMLLEMIIGLFLLPIFLILFRNIYKYRKRFLEFIPLILIIFLFAYVYLSVFVQWVDVRHLLPALPFASLIIAKNVDRKKMYYFAICFIVFILIAGATNFMIKSKQDSTFSSLKNIIDNNPEKTISIPDWELRSLAYLYFNTKIINASETCNTWEKTGSLFYCTAGSAIQISKTIPASSSSS